jgi:hydroxymethylpyrimidine/phosphomethylpyrimidine kinase
LSAAIAAGLAKGMTLDHAVAAAKSYVTAALEASSTLHIGHGSGPVHHFHAFWK